MGDECVDVAMCPVYLSSELSTLGFSLLLETLPLILETMETLPLASTLVVLLSPTSSGKSLIIYLAVRQLLTYKCKKGLIIVPTTSLVEQLYSDFSDYSTKNGWDVQENVHRIYQGRDKHTDLPLTISTWQSLYTKPEEYFHQFDFIIGDEAHLFKAKSLTSIFDKCVNTKYRIGTTGTLDGMKTHKLILEGLFGKVKKVISTKELNTVATTATRIKCEFLEPP